MNTEFFDIGCRQCERLAGFLDEVKSEYPDYFCKPVPPFGDDNAKLLIVGLAPGKHGANASGRPFTGDSSGLLLYQTLHKFGFATASESLSADDDLQMMNARVSNAVKCLPPENRPTMQEVNNCNHFIAAELNSLDQGSVILALGGIAHKTILKTFGYKQSAFKFAHGAIHQLEQGYSLVDSYHCSRYNTQTGRLTTEMFEDVFIKIKRLIG